MLHQSVSGFSGLGWWRPKVRKVKSFGGDGGWDCWEVGRSKSLDSCGSFVDRRFGGSLNWRWIASEDEGRVGKTGVGIVHSEKVLGSSAHGAPARPAVQVACIWLCLRYMVHQVIQVYADRVTRQLKRHLPHFSGHLPLPWKLPTHWSIPKGGTHQLVPLPGLSLLEDHIQSHLLISRGEPHEANDSL